VTPVPLTFAGVDFLMTVSGAFFVPKAGTLIVADLHLEKGSSFARRGTFLPPYDSHSTIVALAAAIDLFRPHRVVCLGDSFHDQQGAERLSGDVRCMLTALSGAHDWIWVTGNHDPEPATWLGGRTIEEFRDNGLIFRHQARLGPIVGEVSGHFHPKVSLIVRGQRVSARCFVTDDRRLIVPAFGSYTGGLDISHPDIEALLQPSFTVHLLGRSRIHAVPGSHLAGVANARRNSERV
jgi:uncharacterized protein